MLKHVETMKSIWDQSPRSLDGQGTADHPTKLIKARLCKLLLNTVAPEHMSNQLYPIDPYSIL